MPISFREISMMVSERLRSLLKVVASVVVSAIALAEPVSAQSDADVCAKETGDKAIGACDRLISQNPKDSSAYGNRGFTWSAKGEYDKAIADFNEAIRLNPKHAKAYNNRGVALSRKREYDKAISDFNESIKLNSKEASAYFNRGNAWEAKGSLQQALSDFKKFSELTPSDSDGPKAVARLEQKLKQ